MRILSKFSDYYDGFSTYGIDSSVLFVRKRETDDIRGFEDERLDDALTNLFIATNKTIRRSPRTELESKLFLVGSEMKLQFLVRYRTQRMSYIDDPLVEHFASFEEACAVRRK